MKSGFEDISFASVFESIDQLVTTEIRLRWMVRGVIPKLYRAARGEGGPITMDIANDILAAIESGKKKFAIITGVYNDERFPVGESDGPYGAIVLGKALELLGAEVIQLCEPEVAEPMEQLRQVLELKSNEAVPLNRTDDAANAKYAEELDAVIFTEKIGPSVKGIYHYATGTPRDGDDSPLDGFCDAMLTDDKLSIGVGDFGNEYGFGKILEQARKILPTGSSCKCPENEGIVCRYATKHLLPSSVSNIGCYGIVSALAMASGRLDILHTPELERALICRGAEVGLIDGGLGKRNHRVDGIPMHGMEAIVDLFAVIPRQYYEGDYRGY